MDMLTYYEHTKEIITTTARMTSSLLYRAQHHVQHCTLQAFELFGALYMHNHDDKYPPRLGF